MARKTQGTQLYYIDPDDDTVVRVVCVTSIDGLTAPIDQVETTCLEDSARTYIPGLATPGAMTFGINFDPQDPSHIRLHELYRLKVQDIRFALGFEGSTVAPTVDSDGDFEMPNPDRDFLVWTGYFSDFPFTFALNSVVTSTIGVQVSGEAIPYPAAT